MNKKNRLLNPTQRFRGFMPVVIDVETAGIDPSRHALLEISAVFLELDEQGFLSRKETWFEHTLPFEGGELDPESLAFNQIDPFQPLRFAVSEERALSGLFKQVHTHLKRWRCRKAVLVGHNAWFDLHFLRAATNRCQLTSPFHSFTCFDTATLAGVFLSETVLSKALVAAGLAYDATEAHSAIYDAEITADLFCFLVNQCLDVD